MSNTNIERNYKCSDGMLKQKADHLHNLVLRDKDPFLTRAVTDTTRSNLLTIINDFNVVPRDVYSRGMLRDATQVKNASRALVVKGCGTIRTMALNKWGENDPKYTIYGFEGMSELTDSNLVELAKNVVYVGTKQLLMTNGLDTEGLTQAILDNLTAKHTDFDKNIDSVRMAETDRNLLTQERVNKGNIVFKEYVRLCNIGKELFQDTDPARYNDYLIGMSHVQAKAPGDTFGSFSGTITNGETSEAMVDVQVTLKGEGMPDLVISSDEDGLVADDNVSTKYTSLEAVMFGFETVSATIEIPANDELVYDIIMTPVPA
jgi:hypothetical protein